MKGKAVRISSKAYSYLVKKKHQMEIDQNQNVSISEALDQELGIK